MDSNEGIQRSVITTEEQNDLSPSLSVRHIDNKSNKIPLHFRSTVLGPLLRESYLTSEYCLLTSQQKLGGLYVIPSAQSPFQWFGILFVHYGPYQGGVFRFIVKFHELFPDSHTLPVVTMTPAVYHPQVNPTRGTLEIKRHFRTSWQRSSNHIWQILKCVRSSFYKIDSSFPANKHAADLYDTSYDKFVARCEREVADSQKRLYDEPPEGNKDPHYIRFSQYSPNIHDAIRAKALKPLTSIVGDAGAVDLFQRKRGLSFLQT